jgi:hypothetical protein
MTDLDRELNRRLSVLVGNGREDWRDVRRRARAHSFARSRRGWIWLVMLAAAIAIAAAPPLGLGRSVLDLFRDPGKPEIPRSEIPPQMRLSFDRKYGNWSVHEIANDGTTAFYALKDGEGRVVCIATGKADRKAARPRGGGPFGVKACGDPTAIFSSERPIYYLVTVEVSIGKPGPRPFRVTGVAVDGVEKIVLTGASDRVETRVKGNAFTFTEFPDAQTIRIAALDDRGKVVHSEFLQGFGPAEQTPPTTSPQTTAPPPPPPPPPLVPLGGERPIQRGRTRDADLRVYPSGLVVFRIAPRSRAAHLVAANYSCMKYTLIDGKEYPVWSGGSASLALSGVELRARPSEPLVQPPYDGCEVPSIFGRRWGDRRSMHDPVEVPLTARGRLFFNEQAAARDLAHFLRSPRILALRVRLTRDTSASLPATDAIRRGLPARVTALAHPDDVPGPNQIGIWSDGKRRFVVSTRSAAKGRLFVEVDSGHIARHNLGDLARVF